MHVCYMSMYVSCGVRMYVTRVCMCRVEYVCMYVCMYVCTYACMLHEFVRFKLNMYVCMYICMSGAF